MTKKTLSALWLFAGAAVWKNSAAKATLALSGLRRLLCLEERTQQVRASTYLVRALDYRGLYAEAACYAERSQRLDPQTCHRTLAAASSTGPYSALDLSLPALRWNVHQRTQRRLCRDGY